MIVSPLNITDFLLLGVHSCQRNRFPQSTRLSFQKQPPLAPRALNPTGPTTPDVPVDEREVHQNYRET
jgi:hypothetical protein